eukprot:CAMPEP_0198122862 /NCGR_PEP_ID=MMETSP1442-20131203/36007_1 /TAXON_ID= /ORGANISM="Craspedostauros australis, Strain CCMP3328" /LENGTH=56 /DNA_ID=CAMNT_0043781959 /DNA_START=64 /DNA_END=230 /DNA_ORIENTATION=+
MTVRLLSCHSFWLVTVDNFLPSSTLVVNSIGTRSSQQVELLSGRQLDTEHHSTDIA